MNPEPLNLATNIANAAQQMDLSAAGHAGVDRAAAFDGRNKMLEYSIEAATEKLLELYGRLIAVEEAQ